jgi:hypothetical protein
MSKHYFFNFTITFIICILTVYLIVSFGVFINSGKNFFQDIFIDLIIIIILL